jgi:hypothetical protein
MLRLTRFPVFPMAPILWEFLTKFMAEMAVESLVFSEQFCGVSPACSQMEATQGTRMGIALSRLGFILRMFYGAKERISVKESHSIACLHSIGNRSF